MGVWEGEVGGRGEWVGGGGEGGSNGVLSICRERRWGGMGWGNVGWGGGKEGVNGKGRGEGEAGENE